MAIGVAESILVAVAILVIAVAIVELAGALAEASGVALSSQAGGMAMRVRIAIAYYTGVVVLYETFKRHTTSADDPQHAQEELTTNHPACPTPSPLPTAIYGPTVIAPVPAPVMRNAPPPCGEQ